MKAKSKMKTFQEFISQLKEGVTDIAVAKRKPLSQRSGREQAAIDAAKQSKPPKGTVEIHLKHEDGSISKSKFKLTKSQSKWDDEAKAAADGHLKNMQAMHDRFPDISGSKAKEIHKVVVK